jgi:hypothetical protein
MPAAEKFEAATLVRNAPTGVPTISFALVGTCQPESTRVKGAVLEIAFALEGPAGRRLMKALEKGGDGTLVLPPKLVLIKKDGTNPEPSPRIECPLPTLAQDDLADLKGRPATRFILSPLTKDLEGSSTDGAGFSFDGGLAGFGAHHRRAWTWSGNVTTDRHLGFNELRTALELEHNARSGDYLPLRMSIALEADQAFQLSNSTAGVQAEYLMPFNINASPKDSRYIVNAGPLVNVRAEAGWKILEDGRSVEASNAPERFLRVGYSARWKVPFAAASVVRLFHAGIWRWDDWKGRGRFHRLWDATVESKLGQLTYFVGYQEGEAAPMYLPVHTTRAGLVATFK